jgi:hypothetical protein
MRAPAVPRPCRSLAALVAALAAAALVVAGAPGASAQADAAPPRTTHTLVAAAPPSASGWYGGPVVVRLTAVDAEGSGIARTEHRVDGGAWQPSTPAAGVRIAAQGVHVVEYRSVDDAGNVEPVRVASFRIDDDAPTVRASVDHGEGAATVSVTADDTTAGGGTTEIAHRIDGGPWQVTELEEAIFDGSTASFGRWRMVGGGRFDLMPDGAMRTVGGMGMLWYPERELGDVAIRLQWRDARDDGQRSNGGVFVRFPDPEAAVALPPMERHACQLGQGLLYAEWSAVGCGHEIQVNDHSADPQKTGSVYNFRSLDSERSRPVPYGEWNEYEIRTVGGGSYAITVVRNGEVINQFVNTPGQIPARQYDPPTDLRQFASGYVGLQNHGGEDTIEYRDIRVLDLAPATTSFPVVGPGAHRVEIRATDDAGNVTTTTTTVTIP